MPYGQEDARKPQVQQEINGIVVGPAVQRGRPAACLGTVPEHVPAEKAAGSELDPDPGYLPEGVEFIRASADACGETVVGYVEEYYAPYVPGTEDPNVPLQTGGTITISRVLMPNDRARLFGTVAERLSPATINGKPAVVLEPLMPDGVDAGFFTGKIVIQEVDGFTRVIGRGLPWAEVLKIAENLQ